MEYVITRNTDTDELMHYGVKGMKWGVRRRSDTTSFRQASKKARADSLAARKEARESGQLNGIGAVRKGNKIQRQATKASLKEQKEQNKTNKKPMSTKKKVAIGAAVAGGVLAAYGANKIIRNANANIRGQQAAEEILKNYVNPTINRNIQAGNIGYNSEAARNFANKATAIARRDGINSATNDSFGTAVKNVYNEVKNIENRSKSKWN